MRDTPRLIVRSAAHAAAWARDEPWALRLLCLIAMGAAAQAARAVLLPLATALLLAVALAPWQRWLMRHRWPVALASAALVVGLAALLLGVVAMASPSALQAWRTAPDIVDRLAARLGPVLASVGAPAELSPAAIRAHLDSLGPPLAERLQSGGWTALRDLSLTALLLYFTLTALPRGERALRAWANRRDRRRTACAIERLQRDLAVYLRTVVVCNLGAGGATGLLLAMIGLPQPAAWGAAVAALCFVPYLGPALLMVLLLAAGLSHFSAPWIALAPLAAFALVHAIETNLVSPWLLGRGLDCPALAVVLAVLVLGGLWGLGGATIAVPALMAGRAAWRARCWQHVSDPSRPDRGNGACRLG